MKPFVGEFSAEAGSLREGRAAPSCGRHAGSALVFRAAPLWNEDTRGLPHFTQGPVAAPPDAWRLGGTGAE